MVWRLLLTLHLAALYCLCYCFSLSPDWLQEESISGPVINSTGTWAGLIYFFLPPPSFLRQKEGGVDEKTSYHKPSILFLIITNCLVFPYDIPFPYFLFFSPFIFISWRLITSQYCSGFCHTLTWISCGFTCVPHPDPRSHLPPHPIPLGLPSAPALSTCLMHPTWAGDLFHPR